MKNRLLQKDPYEYNKIYDKNGESKVTLETLREKNKPITNFCRICLKNEDRNYLYTWCCG